MLRMYHNSVDNNPCKYRKVMNALFICYSRRQLTLGVEISLTTINVSVHDI